jgi:uncharacterized protein (DUF1800 family)
MAADHTVVGQEGDRVRAVRTRAVRATKAMWAAVALAALVACGGNKEDEDAAVVETPASRAEAARFLTQATFGPTEAEIDRVMQLGYGRWIDDQFNKTRASHRTFWETQDAVVKAANAGSSIGADGVYNSFWKQAVSGDDQLRQRVAFALSQIFVISLQDSTVGDNPRAVADYLDMLGTQSFGNYRSLLESVSRHPMMGSYLSSMRNRKADARTGRVPDENYAREVMQLFSIGLQQLNDDGSARQSNGAVLETYTPSDIAGLAKVFTGFSWSCPDWPDNSCFSQGQMEGNADPDRSFKPMLGYPQYHSAEEKSFLGTTIAAQGTANPEASLASALDTLANHPNVGPFIGKQLIQRLVTSNPSPAYIEAVARTFNNNGKGVRGDMKAVVKRVLTHPEARTASATGGKVREPILRLSAVLRAFGYASDSGNYRVGNTDNAGAALGQTVMRSPSVFNFYRPGYVAPGTQSGAAGMTAPELALANETSSAGYVNYMRDNIASGIGATGTVVINGANVNRRDLQPNLAAEVALADRPVDLVERLSSQLMYGGMPAALKSEISAAVATITIPALNGSGSNQAQIDSAKRNRVNAAIFLTVISPEFQVQK